MILFIVSGLKGPIHDQSCCPKLFCATQVCPFTIKSISTIHDQSCCTTRIVCATWLIVYGPLKRTPNPCVWSCILVHSLRGNSHRTAPQGAMQSPNVPSVSRCVRHSNLTRYKRPFAISSGFYSRMLWLSGRWLLLSTWRPQATAYLAFYVIPEPGQFSRYDDRLHTGLPRFDSRQGQEICLFSTASKSALGPLRGFGPLANYADRATAASWRSSTNFCG
jgi:hypothetical protein